MVGDILKGRLPIMDGPTWGVPSEPGLGVEIDDEALTEAFEAYGRDGQFWPFQKAEASS
jgi:L-alanine-DL-glutamate epimerase-like enolase superfamily enzyme